MSPLAASPGCRAPIFGPAPDPALALAWARTLDHRPDAAPRGVARPALCVLALGTALAAFVPQLRAQDDPEAGPLPRLTFDVEQRVEADDNPGLHAEGADPALLAVTGLGFSLLDATPGQRLRLTGALDLRAGGDAEASGLAGPRLGLDYDREGASEAVSLEATYRRAEITVLRGAADFPEGLPPDFEELEGEGIRTSYGLDGSLELGRAGPFGLTLSGGFDTISYSEETAALTDSTRSRAAARLRFRLSPVTEARAGLRASALDDDDGTTRQSGTVDLGFGTALSGRDSVDVALGYTVVETDRPASATDRQDGLTGSLRLSRETPRGPLDVGFGAETTQNGTRTSADIGRSLDMPLGRVGARIGASRGDTGGTDLTGALSWRQELARSRLSAELARSVATTDEEDRLRTALSAAYDTELGPASAFGLDVSYVRSELAGGGDPLDVASLGARLSREITRDWSLTLGYGLRLRDPDDTERAVGNSVYATIGRSYSTGF